MTTIIIGAGASGLACAIRLKHNIPNENVIILERMSQAGKKILATGNGRCNLSNKNAEGYNQVIDFFSGIGLATKIDDEGRVYPYSNQAATVLELLLKECKKLGINIITDCTVKDINKDFSILTDLGDFKADRIIIATGGKAQENLGSNGSGFQLLKNFGHTVTPLYPSLVQLTSPSKYPKALKGQRVKCNMSILFDGETVAKEYGEVLFTDYGLSGIVTMNLSSIVSRNFLESTPKRCQAELDLIPDKTKQELDRYIEKFGNLQGILGSKLSEIIEKQAKGDKSKYSTYAKCWRLIINSTKGFDFAQVTGGGAKLDEFNCFESKLVKNLYACGEVLNKQFACGGFNLNYAWYSGIKTADQIANI